MVQEPKTAKGRRTIALSPASCLVLRKHKEKQEKDADLLGRQLTGDDYVFSHPDGSPRDPSTLTLAFRRLTRRIGLEGVRLHVLRHTMASLYLEQGAILKPSLNALDMQVSVLLWICIPIAFQVFRKQLRFSLILRWGKPNYPQIR
ncbi:MAG: tyrosine-type recombinase/integrase [Chloroflexi bacterium]|nr:tyrosine-type recombinase/integrase [Chloroflexota bacterium]